MCIRNMANGRFRQDDFNELAAEIYFGCIYYSITTMAHGVGQLDSLLVPEPVALVRKLLRRVDRRVLLFLKHPAIEPTNNRRLLCSPVAGQAAAGAGEIRARAGNVVFLRKTRLNSGISERKVGPGFQELPWLPPRGGVG